MIDKPLTVYANDFSLTAVKMIALSGGESVKVVTVKKEK
jgi:ribosomal protein L18E